MAVFGNEFILRNMAEFMSVEEMLAAGWTLTEIENYLDWKDQWLFR